MSFVAVTIHKGELKQIRRSIETAKAKHVEGRLYGLWTHSDQPVIQFVVGPCPGKKKKTKEYFEKCDKYLGENHGLKHIGNWSTKPAGSEKESVEKSDLPCFVRMLVSLSEDTLQVDMRVIWKDPYVNQKAEEGEEPGVLEQLDGESPFRLFSSLTKEIADMAGCAPADIRPDLVDRPLKVNSPDRPVVLKPADVKEEQWYSTEEGMQLFGKIHAALRVNGIAVIETSRDTQTHDIGFTLQLDQHSFRVEFPRNFPRGMASLTEGRKRVNIDLKEVDASSKRARTSAEEEPPKEQHKDGAKFEGDPPQEKECSLQDHDKLSQHLIEKIKRQLSLKVTAAGRHEFGTPV